MTTNQTDSGEGERARILIQTPGNWPRRPTDEGLFSVRTLAPVSRESVVVFPQIGVDSLGKRAVDPKTDTETAGK